MAVPGRYRCSNLDEQPHLAPSVDYLYKRQPPPPDFDDTSLLYKHKPHEKYYWAQNIPIENEGRVIHLGSGMECQVYLKHGTIDGKPITYLSKHWSVHSQMRGFYAEMGLYASSCFLRQLQGDVVPRIIGIYSAPGATVDVAMEPPHRVSWREADKNIDDDLKQKIVDAYAKIHARGVQHGDVELRHMLIGDDGRVTIIDFGLAAVTVDGFEDLGLRRTSPAMLAIEMRRVRFLLDFPRGTRDAELALSRRFEAAVAQARSEGRPCPEAYAPAIPLRVIEEQWMRSADEVGRRFAIPATIPILDGRPRQRNALIVPANAASDEEVENLIPYNGVQSPSSDEEDSEEEKDAPAVKQEPDADGAAVKEEPAEFTVKAEEDEDVKPVIDREEGPSGSKKRRHESESEEPAEPSPSKRARVATPPPLSTEERIKAPTVAGPSRVRDGISENPSALPSSAPRTAPAAPRTAPAPMAPPPAPSAPANGSAPRSNAPGAPVHVPRYGLDSGPEIPLQMRVFTELEVTETMVRSMRAGLPVFTNFKRMGPYFYVPFPGVPPPPMPTSPTAVPRGTPAPPTAPGAPRPAPPTAAPRMAAPAPGVAGPSMAGPAAAVAYRHMYGTPPDGGPRVVQPDADALYGVTQSQLEGIADRAFGIKRAREPEAAAVSDNAQKRVRFDPAVQVHTRPMAGAQHLGIPPRMPGAGAGAGMGVANGNGSGNRVQVPQPRIVVRPPTPAAAPDPAIVNAQRVAAARVAAFPDIPSPSATRH